MPNIFDYLVWRGDLSFEQSRFNAVDGLILSLLSYIDFEGIVPEEFGQSAITIADASQAFFASGADQRMIASRLYSVENYVKLFGKLAETERFKPLRLAGYVSSIDSDEQKQFAAVTILGPELISDQETGDQPVEEKSGNPLRKLFRTLFGKSSAKTPSIESSKTLPESLIFVSYRGTDDTLVGWKEDFNMSFLFAVPSQLSAVDYLEKVAEHYSGQLLLGGHSKGGNLAAYAASFCQEAVQERIDQIFNFDGPGFESGTLSSSGYLNVLKRIHKYLPQFSIVGMMMGHDDPYAVVHSTQNGFNQHNAFSWEVTHDDFVCLDNVTEGSQFIDRTLTDWLKSLDDSQRKKFIDTFYEVLVATKAETIAELTKDWPKNTRIMLKTLHDIDPETRKLVQRALHMFLKAAKTNMPDINPVKKLSERFRKQTTAAENSQE